ncbi:proteinase inhibitor [Arachis duranensis]|uniref:Proteinase inhibitor n=2 Tax=Arachis TaxID=3817 RepID=A0A445EG37_ARAHY|nr:proteinase inhibitor [Arachis duranensis]QHO52649.1 Proteinase inhibitor [Arachis hypogaea]RYR74279.1 hypothetical protein Ahy_A02g008935 [Arachis hypogaea]
MELQCPAKNSWPELMGTKGEKAAERIEEENPNVRAIVVLAGTVVTMDYRCDRVWVWVNKHGLVIRVPRRG